MKKSVARRDITDTSARVFVRIGGGTERIADTERRSSGNRFHRLHGSSCGGGGRPTEKHGGKKNKKQTAAVVVRARRRRRRRVRHLFGKSSETGGRDGIFGGFFAHSHGFGVDTTRGRGPVVDVPTAIGEFRRKSHSIRLRAPTVSADGFYTCVCVRARV